MNDRAFEALAADHRRRVLLALETRDSETDPLTVPDGVANGLEDEDDLYRSLYHTHLPKLVELELVDWDVDQQSVRRGPQFEEVRPLLQFLIGDREVA